jgi:hypothetical protein
MRPLVGLTGAARTWPTSSATRGRSLIRASSYRPLLTLR